MRTACIMELAYSCLCPVIVFVPVWQVLFCWHNCRAFYLFLPLCTVKCLRRLSILVSGHSNLSTHSIPLTSQSLLFPSRLDLHFSLASSSPYPSSSHPFYFTLSFSSYQSLWLILTLAHPVSWGKEGTQSWLGESIKFSAEQNGVRCLAVEGGEGRKCQRFRDEVVWCWV